MSVDSLNRLYNSESSVYERNEFILTQDRKDDIITIFQHVISDLMKIFQITESSFSELLFRNDKNYNKDIVFIVMFLSFDQLYSENYFVEDYRKLNSVLNNIADAEMKEIINSSACIWNPSVRTHLIDRIKNIMKGYMSFHETDPKWNAEFIAFLKKLFAENQMCDFKIGVHDLRSGQENDSVIPKCVMTLTAMANTTPHKEGVVVLGISDRESDAGDFSDFYKTEVLQYNNLFVSGVIAEANKFYGSIQNFTRHIKEIIEKQHVNPEVIQYILTNMGIVRYGDKALVVLKLKTDKPLFYDDKMYVRYESHNNLVKNGSPEFYEVLSNFKENITVTQTVNRKSIKKLDAF